MLLVGLGHRMRPPVPSLALGPATALAARSRAFARSTLPLLGAPPALRGAGVRPVAPVRPKEEEPWWWKMDFLGFGKFMYKWVGLLFTATLASRASRFHHLSRASARAAGPLPTRRPHGR